jgi:hypothetical protein
MSDSKAAYDPASAATTGTSIDSGSNAHHITPAQLSPSLWRNPNDPPTYTEDGANINDRIRELSEAARGDGQDLPISEYPRPEVYDFYRERDLNEVTRRRQDIVATYFDAIKTKKDEVVAALIESGVVTTETTNNNGRTPLIAAIESGNTRTVQQLMDFDADINAFGIVVGMPPPYYGKKPAMIKRTPLMVAAEKGNLTIVKLIMETYGADDSIIAPDGELALRLAASNGHREVVDYLPSRRAGGFKRWKTKHGKAMKRIKRAVRGMYEFFRVILYEVPRFFLWSIPKHAIVLPLVRGAKWLHKHRAALPQMILAGLKAIGRRLKEFPFKVWRVIKEIPSAIKEFAKFIWQGIKRLPKALKIALLWVWSGIKRIGTSISNIFTRLFSFLHTVFAAIASFFRNITLKDVWDGLVALLRAIVVEAPKKIWEWLCKFERMTLKMFEALWGCTGWLLWMLLRSIVELFIYLPKKLVEILLSCGMSIQGGCREILIWIDPKRK